MGKNYYGKSIQSQKEWEESKKKLLEDAAGREMLTKIVEGHFEANKPPCVHIGKSSYGWDFLFNLNKKEHYSNKEELIEWLKACVITSEYGEEISFDEFWNTVVLNRKFNGGPTRTHRSDSRYFSDYFVIDGLEFVDREFS